MAAGLPAVPGLVWALGGRHDAWWLLALTAISGALLTTGAGMYEARQKTLRQQIGHHSTDALTAALARCLDDAHARAQHLSGAREIEEAARVRASAREILTEIMPPVAALIAPASREKRAVDGDPF